MRPSIAGASAVASAWAWYDTGAGLAPMRIGSLAAHASAAASSSGTWVTVVRCSVNHRPCAVAMTPNRGIAPDIAPSSRSAAQRR